MGLKMVGGAKAMDATTLWLVIERAVERGVSPGFFEPWAQIRKPVGLSLPQRKTRDTFRHRVFQTYGKIPAYAKRFVIGCPLSAIVNGRLLGL